MSERIDDEPSMSQLHVSSTLENISLALEPVRKLSLLMSNSIPDKRLNDQLRYTSANNPPVSWFDIACLATDVSPGGVEELLSAYQKGNKISNDTILDYVTAITLARRQQTDSLVEFNSLVASRQK